MATMIKQTEDGRVMATAIIMSDKPSQTMNKSNGGTYVLVNADVFTGKKDENGNDIFIPMAATFTTKNREGKTKAYDLVKGQEVTVYIQRLPSTTEPGKFAYFAEISTGIEAASAEALDAAFAGMFA